MSDTESVATINIRGGATPRDVALITEKIESDYQLNYELYNGQIEVLREE